MGWKIIDSAGNVIGEIIKESEEDSRAGLLVLVFIIMGLFFAINSHITSPKDAIDPSLVCLSSTPTTALEIKIDESLREWCQDNMPSGVYYRDYHFFADEIWVWALIGVYYPQDSAPGRILYSSNNGKSWEIKWEKERTSIQLVYPLNEFEVIVVIDHQILIKTSDGGKTWNQLLTLKNLSGLWAGMGAANRGETINVVFVTDGTNVSNAVIRTNDRGKTWEYANTDTYQNGLMTWVLRTYDGGKTWEKINIRHK